MVSLLLLSSFAILLFLKVPIAVCLGISSIIALVGLGIGFDMISPIFYASINKTVLLAIPFFILGGNIMEKAGISVRLIKMAQAFVGHIRGGAFICMYNNCMFLRGYLWIRPRNSSCSWYDYYTNHDKGGL